MSRLNTEGRIVVKHRSGRPKRLAPKIMSDIRAKLKRGTTSLRGFQKIMQAKGVFLVIALFEGQPSKVHSHWHAKSPY